MKNIHYIASVAAALFISSTAWAGALIIPNTFTADTPAANASFTFAKKTTMDDINTATAYAATNMVNIASNTMAMTNLQNTVLVLAAAQPVYSWPNQNASFDKISSQLGRAINPSFSSYVDDFAATTEVCQS